MSDVLDLQPPTVSCCPPALHHRIKYFCQPAARHLGHVSFRLLNSLFRLNLGPALCFCARQPWMRRSLPLDRRSSGPLEERHWKGPSREASGEWAFGNGWTSSSDCGQRLARSSSPIEARRSARPDEAHRQGGAQFTLLATAVATGGAQKMPMQSRPCRSGKGPGFRVRTAQECGRGVAAVLRWPSARAAARSRVRLQPLQVCFSHGRPARFSLRRSSCTWRRDIWQAW